MIKLSFAGHETFHCRNYWLKKGLDHIWSGQQFNDNGIIGLGVGKNMVASIRFWLRSFGVIDDNDQPTEIAEYIFKDKGVDPFCEDIGTIWLLHYLLVTNEKSTTAHFVYNVFRKQRVEFSTKQLLSFLERQCKAENANYNSNSIRKDITVFLRNYSIPAKSKGIEDDFSGLLYELNLVQRLDKYDENNWFKIENKNREELPFEIVLFCILTNEKYGDSISFNELLNDTNSVGSVFVLSSNGLMIKINQMREAYPSAITFADNGGIRVLQFQNKKKLNPWTVLSDYHGQ
jgi:hypothetical protein